MATCIHETAEAWWEEIGNYKLVRRKGRRMMRWKEDFESDESNGLATKKKLSEQKSNPISASQFKPDILDRGVKNLKSRVNVEKTSLFGCRTECVA
jgi:hypothetical protein